MCGTILLLVLESGWREMFQGRVGAGDKPWKGTPHTSTLSHKSTTAGLKLMWSGPLGFHLLGTVGKTLKGGRGPQCLLGPFPQGMTLLGVAMHSLPSLTTCLPNAHPSPHFP